jgi:hypothetical protein
LISFPRYVRVFFLNPNPDPVDAQSWYLHLNHLVSFLAAVFFFVSHVPEIFAHGEFDMIGQGHQIWHVLLVCTMVFQLYATQFDYNTRERRADVVATLPVYETCFYAVSALIAVDLIFIFYASRIARKVVDEERQELRADDLVDAVPKGREDKPNEQGEERVETNVYRVVRKSTRLQRRVVVGKS